MCLELSVQLVNSVLETMFVSNNYRYLTRPLRGYPLHTVYFLKMTIICLERGF